MRDRILFFLNHILLLQNMQCSEKEYRICGQLDLPWNLSRAAFLLCSLVKTSWVPLSFTFSSAQRGYQYLPWTLDMKALFLLPATYGLSVSYSLRDKTYYEPANWFIIRVVFWKKWCKWKPSVNPYCPLTTFWQFLAKCRVAELSQVKTNHRSIIEAFLTKVSADVGSLYDRK